MKQMNFKSDNYYGVHPDILQGIIDANGGDAGSYGHDTYSEQMEEKLSEVFEHKVKCFLTSTGTVCNSLCLSAICPPYGIIFCTKEAHIMNDECTAPSFFTGGAKTITCNASPSKISIEQMEKELNRANGNPPHGCKPACITITQTTELGLVYTLDELKAIGDFAKKHNLNLHLDGARFANALDALGCTPAEMTWKVGVDVMSFGATKNGGLMGEVVIFFNEELAKNFEFLHKRAGQLLSKTRFFSAQILAYLKDGLWMKLARHSNQMAKLLEAKLKPLTAVKITAPVEANEVFVTMSRKMAEALWEQGVQFYEWEGDNLYRLVTSWATTEEMIDKLVETITKCEN